MIPGNFYHTYNHANGRENLFIEPKNYYFFMQKISLYLLPFVKLHAYCLLPNHFHLLISIKKIEEINLLENFKTIQELPDEKLQPIIEKKISKAFSNLFSSYTQAFNKVYERKGSLFIPNMKNILIEYESSLCKVTWYIHANPVHHRFVKNMGDWKFSSFNSYLSESETKLSKEDILHVFGSKECFISYHNQPIELKYKWDS